MEVNVPMRKEMHLHSLRERKEGDFLVQPSPASPKEMAGTGHCEEVLLSPRNVFPTASFVFFLLAS